MRRVAWLTDIHLNFLHESQRRPLLERLAGQQVDAWLIGGDIAEAPTLVGDLEQLADRLPAPIYFVLGNHDFYHGSIADVRAAMARLCRQRPRLVYLSQTGVVELTPRVALVGHDGWADARVGDYDNSSVMLNDYRLISELAAVGKSPRRGLLERLGDEAAEYLGRQLDQALPRYERVLLLTHVPPLREACWHEGRISDDEWSPHFTCQAVGDVLMERMRRHPERRLTVLCGHTHSAGEARPLPNVEIFTGGAVYGRPEIQRVLELE